MVRLLQELFQIVIATLAAASDFGIVVLELLLVRSPVGRKAVPGRWPQQVLLVPLSLQPYHLIAAPCTRRQRLREMWVGAEP